MFFKKTHETKYSSITKFLKTFPLEEFWRFFVERGRYDYREKLYRFVYKQLTLLDDESLKKIPTETILKDTLFQDITIQEYQDLLEERGLSLSVLEFLNLKGKSADKEKLKSHLDMHQGVGFRKQRAWLLDGHDQSIMLYN